MTELKLTVPCLADSLLKVFNDLVFVYKRYPAKMVERMAEIAIRRNRIATTIHAKVDPSDCWFCSKDGLLGDRLTVSFVVKVCDVVTV